MDEILKALSRGHHKKALKLMELHGPSLSCDDAVAVLWQAAVAGRASVLLAALELGAPVDAVDHEGTTALMRAALLERSDCVLALVEAGADVNRVRADGRTALMQAARGGDPASVQALLTAGAKPNAVTPEGERAVTAAVDNGRWEALEVLFRGGALADLPDRDGTPLLCRLASQNPQLVGPALDAGADPASVEPAGRRTALHFAASAGYPQAVSALLAHGAKLKARTQSGRTPLFSALAGDTRRDGALPATVKVLLDAGADVHATTPEGYGVLAFALTWSGPEAVPLLLTAGARANPPRPGRPAAAHVAAARGYLEVLRLLLEAGADMEYPANPEGRTALMFAAGGGDAALATAELLLYHGARVHVWSRDGRSPMALAAQQRSVRMIKLLSDHGASVHPRDGRDVVPLGVAATEGHAQVVQALLEAGADPNASGLNGRALERAVTRPHTKVVRILLDAGADPNLGSPPPLLGAMQCGTWDDRRPYQRPRSRRHDISADVVEMLLAAGADPNVAHDGRSALDLASGFRCPEVVRMVQEAGGRSLM